MGGMVIRFVSVSTRKCVERRLQCVGQCGLLGCCAEVCQSEQGKIGECWMQNTHPARTERTSIVDPAGTERTSIVDWLISHLFACGSVVVLDGLYHC
jgi:hypothetical protein